MSTPFQKKEQVFFRVVGITLDQMRAFQKLLDGVTVEQRQRKGKDDFVLSVELSNPVICDIIQRALSSSVLNAPHGLYVSLVTESDSDGVRLEPFICEFWKVVGGDLDFSFTVV
jgi:hypothetical protein